MGFSSLQIGINAEIIYIRISMFSFTGNMQYLRTY